MDPEMDLEGVVGALADEVLPEGGATEAQNDTQSATDKASDTQSGTEGADKALEGEDGDDEAGLTDAEKESRSQRRRRQRREHTEQLERDNQTLAQQNARLKERLEKLEPPRQEDYDNPDDYIADRAAYAGQKAQIEGQLEEAQEATEAVGTAREAVRAEAFSEASADARTRYADFDKVALGQHWKPTPVMMDVILDSDRSADLAYYLGANPQEVATLSRLSDAQQAAALGRIEARLPTPTKQPLPSSAPPPIVPLKGTGSVADKAPSEMGYAEYAAWRRGKTA